MRPPLALIAAVARNSVIGAGNRLPWRLPEDLRHFKALTMGHAVIMGRRTWQSLPNALPGRQNIVVTHQRGFVAPGAVVATTLDDALALVDQPPPPFCIGGGVLFADALPRATVLYMTEIDREYAGDAHFPRIDPAEWQETARERHAGGGPEALTYSFVTYERR